MFELSAAEASATYADHVARLVAALTADFGDGSSTVNLVTAHLTVVGGTLGGGERDAHTIEAYAVPSSIFPVSTHYVALGHLHRRQQVVGPCPVHYCGSPLAVDFGEEENAPSVSIVEVTATTSAKVAARTVDRRRPVAHAAGQPRRARRDAGRAGRVAAGLRAGAAPRRPARGGPGAAAPGAGGPHRPDRAARPRPAAPPARRAGRSPTELFAEYLGAKGIADEAVGTLFNELHDELVSEGVAR